MVPYHCLALKSLTYASSIYFCVIYFTIVQVPANSQGAKAGLAPTKRGFAGKIILGDIITAVDNKPVSTIFMFPTFYLFVSDILFI